MTTTYTLSDSGCTQQHPARRVIGAIRDWYADGYDFNGERISKAAILRAFRDARKAEKAENPDGPVDFERLAYWYADGVSRLAVADEDRNEWLTYMALHVAVADERE